MGTHFSRRSRTRVEARVALPEPGEEPQKIATPTRRFSLLEITSGLPDDSREADDRQEERRMREMQARVKVARAVVLNSPGLAGTLTSDWRKTAEFCARYGITERMLRYGVPAGEGECLVDAIWWPTNQLAEALEHAYDVLPSPEAACGSRSVGGAGVGAR